MLNDTPPPPAARSSEGLPGLGCIPSPAELHHTQLGGGWTLGQGLSPWTPPFPLAQDLYPESVSFVLGTQGHNFTLHLRKNR